MLILLTGATGFLGRHLLGALLAAGHTVRAVHRGPSPVVAGVHWVQADFVRDRTPAAWRPHLQGVDAVVNAVGIFREAGAQSFEALHERAPIALFQAAADAGVARVIQISALGADNEASTPYHLSKKHADDFLLTLPLAATVLQPSLVYGPGGASAQALQKWAALPRVPLPGEGAQPIQPVFIDDLAEAVVKLLAGPPWPGRLAAVGPEPVSLRDYLAALRRGMGLGAPRFVQIPRPLVKAAVALAAQVPGSLADPDSLAMLERGNTADAAPFTRLLGHAPRAPRTFIRAEQARSERAVALLGHLLPLLRVSIALTWLVTGVVSLWVHPVADSLEMLRRVGVPDALGPAMLYGAAGLDFALGLGILVLRDRRRLWRAQIALIAFYTAVITLHLPEFWAHPYGPLLKNLPLLAAIWLLYTLEKN